MSAVGKALQRAARDARLAGTFHGEGLADGIAQAPGDFLDAMVADGLLEKSWTRFSDDRTGVVEQRAFDSGCYRVRKPHVHAWVVIRHNPEMTPSLTLGCQHCPMEALAKSQLPIEPILP